MWSPLPPFIPLRWIPRATAASISDVGASIFVPLFWSPRTARNSRLAGITAPCARRGRFNCGTFGISKPKLSPPKSGIQSGTSKLIEFTAFITALIPLTKKFTTLSNREIIPFTKPPNAPEIASKTPVAISFNPCHARSQSPTRTPVTKSSSPVSAVTIPSIKSIIPPKRGSTTAAIILNTSTKTGPKVSSYPSSWAGSGGGTRCWRD